MTFWTSLTFATFHTRLAMSSKKSCVRAVAFETSFSSTAARASLISDSALSWFFRCCLGPYGLPGVELPRVPSGASGKLLVLRTLKETFEYPHGSPLSAKATCA